MFVAKKTLPLDAIRIDGGTQSRQEINTDWVGSIYEKMLTGTVFKPVVVFFDGKEYWLADGFHRYHALRSIAPGFFEQRRDLYNLYPLLVHVRLFGGGYVPPIERTLAGLGL